MIEGIARLARLFGIGSVTLEAGGVGNITTAEGLGDLLLENLLVAELC